LSKVFDAGRRDNVNHMASSLTREHGQRGGDTVERATQIDVDHGVPILDAQRIEARYWTDSGIVDDGVKLAAPVDRQCDKRFEIAPVTNVSHLEGGLAASGCTISSTHAESASSLRALSTTKAPRSANSFAVARPIPLLAPVMATTLPSMPIAILLSG
jgi:hypothetical protein